MSDTHTPKVNEIISGIGKIVSVYNGYVEADGVVGRVRVPPPPDDMGYRRSVENSVTQLELPGIPHAPSNGEAVCANGNHLGEISYVYPATKSWAGNEVTGYRFHVDVFSPVCSRYTQVYMSDDAWNGSYWDISI